MISKSSLSLKSRTKGTGSILQDLVSSSVVLIKNDKLFSKSLENIEDIKVKVEIKPEFKSQFHACSICHTSHDYPNIQPFTQKESSILNELILNREIPPWSLCCKNCSKILNKLYRLNQEMENIIGAIRWMIRIENENDESK
jgi:hypothetical protein